MLRPCKAGSLAAVFVVPADQVSVKAQRPMILHGPPSVYCLVRSVPCIAVWQHAIDIRSPVWSRGCGTSSAGCGR